MRRGADGDGEADGERERFGRRCLEDSEVPGRCSFGVLVYALRLGLGGETARRAGLDLEGDGERRVWYSVWGGATPKTCYIS